MITTLLACTGAVGVTGLLFKLSYDRHFAGQLVRMNAVETLPRPSTRIEPARVEDPYRTAASRAKPVAHVANPDDELARLAAQGTRRAQKTALRVSVRHLVLHHIPMLEELSARDAKDIDDDLRRSPTSAEASVNHHVVALGNRQRALVFLWTVRTTANRPSRPWPIPALCWMYRNIASHLRKHDDRAEFLAGVDLILTGVTASL